MVRRLNTVYWYMGSYREFQVVDKQVLSPSPITDTVCQKRQLTRERRVHYHNWNFTPLYGREGKKKRKGLSREKFKKGKIGNEGRRCQLTGNREKVKLLF